MTLIAHWQFSGNPEDAQGVCHSKAHNISYTTGVDGEQNGAALFNGMDSFIEIDDTAALRLGTNDFTFSLWVKADGRLENPRGDLLCKFDETRRTGLNLSLSSSSPGYSSIGDSRNIHFGIDNDRAGEWEDCGKPKEDNSLISTLVVYKGELYTGIADALDPNDACRVYKYAGNRKWVDCGRVGDDPRTLSVYSILVHNGGLYAGTGTWDWEKTVEGIGGPNHVYRYEGGTTWVDCGAFGTGLRVLCLASFKGNLYAGDDTGRCYRYDGGTSWTFCGRLDDEAIRLYTMMVWQGNLYAGATGNFYRYDGGEKWTCIGERPFENTQVHTFQVYHNGLIAGTWPHGKVLKYTDGDEWEDWGQLGISTEEVKINEINDLTVYNGVLYAGVIPKSEVYRHEGGHQWSKVAHLVRNEDWSAKDPITWCRVPCLTVYDGKLYAGTSTCHGRAANPDYPEAGRVYALQAGQCVSYNDDLGDGWHHIAAVRENGELTLYIDGKAVSNHSDGNKPLLDIATSTPLFIGRGSQCCFTGAMDDLRIYNEALSSESIQEIMNSI